MAERGSKGGGRGGKGVSVVNCPIGFDVCYPSCYFWRDGKCAYDEIIQETEGGKAVAEVTLKLTKSQAIVVGFLVGEFYRFMVKEGVSEISVASQEVADLVDKLTKAVGGEAAKEG